jgi:hypothetical protein
MAFDAALSPQALMAVTRIVYVPAARLDVTLVAVPSGASVTPPSRLEPATR